MTVRIERDGPVTVVTIDRPEVRNAVDGADRRRRSRTRSAASTADDDALVAVLTGAGGVFCAGADLTAMPRRPRQPGRARRRRADGTVADAARQAGDRGGRGLRGRGRPRARAVVRPARRGTRRGVRRVLPPLGRAARSTAARCASRASSALSHALDLILTGRGVVGRRGAAHGAREPAERAGPRARRTRIALAHELAALPQVCLRSDRRSAYEQHGLSLDDALAHEFDARHRDAAHRTIAETAVRVGVAVTASLVDGAALGAPTARATAECATVGSPRDGATGGTGSRRDRRRDHESSGRHRDRRRDGRRPSPSACATQRVGSVVVVDDDRAVGILTERDLVRIAAVGRRARETVADWMTADPDSVGPDVDATTAFASLAEHGYRHIPVVDDGQLVGIVSMRDLMRIAQIQPADAPRARRADAGSRVSSSPRRRIGDVRGLEGFYHYRQYNAVELAETRSIEDVWYLLYEGELPDAAQRRAVHRRDPAARARSRTTVAAVLPEIARRRAARATARPAPHDRVAPRRRARLPAVARPRRSTELRAQGAPRLCRRARRCSARCTGSSTASRRSTRIPTSATPPTTST